MKILTIRTIPNLIRKQKKTEENKNLVNKYTLVIPFRAPVAIFRHGRSRVTQVISSPSCASTTKNVFRPDSISHAAIVELSAQVITYIIKYNRNKKENRIFTCRNFELYTAQLIGAECVSVRLPSLAASCPNFIIDK